MTTHSSEFHPDTLDAERWRFLARHWDSQMQCKPLHEWLATSALRHGSVTAALDYAMNYHYNSERHIQR